MRFYVQRIILTLVASIIMSSSACAGALEDGIAKFQAKQYSQANDILSPLADNGDMKAAKYIAFMYREGLGVEKDLLKACDYFEQASTENDGESIVYLGMCYLDGGGRRADIQKAYQLLREGSENGYYDALSLQASVAFQIGDYPSAFGYYVAAAKEGDMEAMLMIGAMYRDGLFVTQDYKRACEWFVKALPSKIPAVLHNYGDCLYFGLDRPVDKKGAYPYFKEAAHLGSEKAKSAAEAIYKELYETKD